VVRLAGSDYDLKKKYDFRQIEIIRDYDPTAGTVPCDRTEIEQVFLNVIKNATQAMADAAKAPPHRITLRTRHEAQRVCVEIEDNGPGMDARTCKRVFEPFFTTKPVGIGTGLGLSVSYFIVTEHHGGTIAVSSTPGQGTCFVICLPLGGKGPA
jgi:signal transduction histidine kinase